MIDDELGAEPPGVEVCSCDEALALRARVHELEAELHQLGRMFDAAVSDRDLGWQSIARARKILGEGHPVGSPEARLASDLREALGDG